MDPSKFSLGQTLYLLNQHIDALPFRPLSHYVGGHLKEVVEGKVRTLRWWLGRVMKPGNLPNDAMVYTIPVRCTTFGTSGRIRRIEYERFFLDRTTGGGNYGHWFLEQASFHPVLKSTELFDLSDSRISHLSNDADVEKIILLPADFSYTFWGHIAKWVNDSIRAREQMIQSVQPLKEIAEQMARKEVPAALVG